jgi:hypothetical protein
MKRTWLALGVVGLVGVAHGGLGCGGKAVIVGGDGGSGGGGVSCTSLSKCPADPAVTQSEIQACEMAQSDPKCGADFTALLDCAFTNQMCDASGRTIVPTACNTQEMTYAGCLAPPFDAGGGASCTSVSKCPNDPVPPQSAIQQCQMDMNDAACGAAFSALLNCVYANQMCDSAGHTMQTQACNAQAMTYSSCLTGPRDAGVSGG